MDIRNVVRFLQDHDVKNATYHILQGSAGRGDMTGAIDALEQQLRKLPELEPHREIFERAFAEARMQAKGTHREPEGFRAVGTPVEMCAAKVPTGADMVFTQGDAVLFTTGLSNGIAISTLCDFDPSTGHFTQRGMIHLGADDYGTHGNARLVRDLAEALHSAPHVVIAFGREYERDYFTSKTWAPTFLAALRTAMEERGKAPPTTSHVLFTGVAPETQQPGSFAVAPDGSFGFLRLED